MPGIFGIFNFDSGSIGVGNTSYADALKVMAQAMRYEPFYDSRLYENYSDLGIYVGWVGSVQNMAYPVPILDGQNRVSIFLSGTLADEVIIASKNFQSCTAESDQGHFTLSQYVSDADKFPEKIGGSASGILIDEQRKHCFLFNDRFGMERLFLYQDDEKMVFSSEAKAILAIIPETRSFDPEGLGQFLACGCTLGEKSLFRKIRILPGGSAIKLVKGRPPRLSKYFDRSTLEDSQPLSAREFLESFCNTLKVVVSKYSKPLSLAAVSLTGGLDSRMIMSCLNAPDGTVPCYTFGSMYRETYDVLVARKVAKQCRQPHQVLVLGKDFLEKFKDYLEKAIYISDGYLGFSGAAELYLNNLARSIAPLRITGNYGGELLRGVRAFKSSIPNGQFLNPEMIAWVEVAARAFSRISRMSPVSFTLFVQVPSGYGRYAIERSQVSVFSPFLDDALVRLIYRNRARGGDDKDPSFDVIKKCCSYLLEIPTDRGLLGRGSWAERAFRRLYREASFKMEYWTDHGMPSWLAAHSNPVLNRALERKFVGRHKFQHFRLWMQSSFSTYVQDIMNNKCKEVEGFFEHHEVDNMMHEHFSGKNNYTNEIDKILTIIITQDRLFKDNTYSFGNL